MGDKAEKYEPKGGYIYDNYSGIPEENSHWAVNNLLGNQRGVSQGRHMLGCSPATTTQCSAQACVLFTTFLCFIICPRNNVKDLLRILVFFRINLHAKHYCHCISLYTQTYSTVQPDRAKTPWDTVQLCLMLTVNIVPVQFFKAHLFSQKS